MQTADFVFNLIEYSPETPVLPRHLSNDSACRRVFRFKPAGMAEA